MYAVNEKDWKLFRKLVPMWQERYMEKLNKEYISILSGKEEASFKFWELEKRINQDKEHPGIILKMSRSKMFENLYIMLRDNVITNEDLEGFSIELIEGLNKTLEVFNN